MAIRDWPADERPREKLLEKGAAALSDAELLAILLRTGTSGHSALDLARNVLASFQSLRKLIAADRQKFCAQRGLGAARFAELQAAVEIMARHGRIVLVALLTEAPLNVPAYPILAKELQILGSLMSTKEDVQRAIELVSTGQVDVEAIATHTLPIEEAQRGMELVHSKDDGAIKVILSF